MAALNWRVAVAAMVLAVAGCSMGVSQEGVGGVGTRDDVQIGAGRGRADWMGQARWGLFTHYLADWKARDLKIKMTVAKWNEMVDGFDAEGLADQLQRMGVKYYVLTIGQNSGYYCSPNATYDKFVGTAAGASKLSHRDLIADVADAVHRRGIHFMVYLPAGAPGGDKAAAAKLGWERGPNRNREFQLKWEAVIREWSLRWGDKVEGWWFDGCYWPNTMYRYAEAPNFRSFAAAARAGNPKSIVAFNPGPVIRMISSTPYEDYTGGEVTNPETFIARRIGPDGKLDGVQPHILTYLGKAWGHGEPRLTDAILAEWASRVSRTGTAITLDVPIDVQGRIEKAFEGQIEVVRKTVAETRVKAGSESSATKPAATEPADERG